MLSGETDIAMSKAQPDGKGYPIQEYVSILKAPAIDLNIIDATRSASISPSRAVHVRAALRQCIWLFRHSPGC